MVSKLNRELVMRALTRLGHLAIEEGLRLECCVDGGALMMLAYNAREATRDVDVVIRPRDPALRLAKVVAQELELPEDWLNDQVRTFLAPTQPQRVLPLDLPGVQVTAPTAGYLLSMKALACRTARPGYTGDLDDLRFLTRKMEIHDVEEIQKRIDPYDPDDVIPPAHRETLRVLISEVWAWMFRGLFTGLRPCRMSQSRPFLWRNSAGICETGSMKFSGGAFTALKNLPQGWSLFLPGWRSTLRMRRLRMPCLRPMRNGLRTRPGFPAQPGAPTLSGLRNGPGLVHPSAAGCWRIRLQVSASGTFSRFPSPSFTSNRVPASPDKGEGW